MEYQDNDLENLSLEQIEKLIAQTKLEIMELQQKVIDKNNHLIELLRLYS